MNFRRENKFLQTDMFFKISVLAAMGAASSTGDDGPTNQGLFLHTAATQKLQVFQIRM